MSCGGYDVGVYGMVGVSGIWCVRVCVCVICYIYGMCGTCVLYVCVCVCAVCCMYGMYGVCVYVCVVCVCAQDILCLVCGPGLHSHGGCEGTEALA